MTSELKRWIHAAFLMYIIGVQLDLLLIGHYESFWQYLPIVILPFLLILALVYWVSGALWLSTALKVFSVLLCLMGVAGIYFHLQSNFQFEVELRPYLSGMALWKESMTGALPVLAPASLIPLGLLNYVISESKKLDDEIDIKT